MARSATTSRAPRRGSDVVHIVQSLRRIVKALHTYSQDVYRGFGLTAPQLWALKTLQRRGRLSTGALAEALAVHQSSLSLLIDRLERRGLVRRIRSAKDRRVVQIALSKRGASLSAQAPEPAQGRLLHGLQGMRVGEVKNIRRAVDRLVTVMEAQDVKAQFFFSES